MSYIKSYIKNIKSWFLKTRIKYVRRLIYRFQTLLRRYQPRQKIETEFNTLSPTFLTGRTFSYYNKTLLWAVNNTDCLNIAISGIYGAGKSSIIKSFVNNNRQFEVLPISLGTFKDEPLKDEQLSKLYVFKLKWTFS